jgi:hypothetical protein
VRVPSLLRANPAAALSCRHVKSSLFNARAVYQADRKETGCPEAMLLDVSLRLLCSRLSQINLSQTNFLLIPVSYDDVRLNAAYGQQSRI